MQLRTYVCEKENETPRTIAKKMSLTVDEVLAHNKHLAAELLPTSRFRNATKIYLPLSAPPAPTPSYTSNTDLTGASSSTDAERGEGRARAASYLSRIRQRFAGKLYIYIYIYIYI